MLLLWPLDDRLYQISLNAVLNAFPFLFLPWTPIGIELDVQQSTISGLLSYLLNWTPQDFQNYYGSTIFRLSLQGLILHFSIFIIYIHFVLRPLAPSNVKIFNSFKIKDSILSLRTSIVRYWKKIPKELLAPGIMLILIGFSLGPLISSEVVDSTSSSGTIEFNAHIFKPFVQINLETVSQILDPNALQSINISYQISSNGVPFAIDTIIVPSDWFNSFSSDINHIANQYINENVPNNDTNFKLDYQTYLHNKISNDEPLYIYSVTNSGTNFNYVYNTTKKGFFSIGFILSNWESAQLWNETYLYFTLQIHLEQAYERNINWILGTTIQLSGLLIVLIAILPFKKKEPKIKN